MNTYRMAIDVAERDEATEQVRRAGLFHEHWALARSLAARFRGRGVPVEDLAQVAAIGLIKAIDRFDPSRGTAFAGYAVPTIMGELRRHFRGTWSIHVTRGVQEAHAAVNGAVDRLSQTLRRSPTISEIAEETGLAQDEILSALDSARSYRAMSLDDLAAADGWSAEPGAEDEGFDAALERVELARAFRVLTSRERTVVFLRFYEGLTQSEIGERVGCSQMHVSRLLSGALGKIRAHLETSAKHPPSAASPTANHAA
jgi:RNA polymerase sigma-B factor